jgi:hypothetical protein
MGLRMFDVSLLPLAAAVIVLSAFSGVAAYLQGIREGKFEGNWLNLSGEITSSVVAGMAVFFLGSWQEYPEALTCLVALVAASKGKESLSALWDMFFKR